MSTKVALERRHLRIEVGYSRHFSPQVWERRAVVVGHGLVGLLVARLAISDWISNAKKKKVGVGRPLLPSAAPHYELQ